MKMKYGKLIKKIAEQQGVSPESVYAEILKAIQISYNDPNPARQAYWRNIAPDGELPTPEQFIKILADEIQMK